MIKNNTENIYIFFYYLFCLTIYFELNGINKKNLELPEKFYKKMKENFDLGNLRKENKVFLEIFSALDGILYMGDTSSNFLSDFEDFLEKYKSVTTVIKNVDNKNLIYFYFFNLFLFTYSFYNFYDFEKYLTWRLDLIDNMKKINSSGELSKMNPIFGEIPNVLEKIIKEKKDWDFFVTNYRNFIESYA